TAVEADITREEMDAWSVRSQERAIAAIDSGVFDEEIVAVQALQADGSRVEFAVDEHPRRGTTMDKLAGLNALHPAIEGFSITAGNASGINDAAAAVVVVGSDFAAEQGLETLAVVRSWAASAVEPARTGMAVLDVIPKALDRAGITIADVAL